MEDCHQTIAMMCHVLFVVQRKSAFGMPEKRPIIATNVIAISTDTAD